MAIEIEISTPENEPAHFFLVHLGWFRYLVGKLMDALDQTTQHRFCNKFFFHWLEQWKHRGTKTFQVSASAALCQNYMHWAGWPQLNDEKVD